MTQIDAGGVLDIAMADTSTTVARADVFRLHANFRVAHVFIFNAREELLLQELAPNRRGHPGRCALRVASEIPAYEDNVRVAWHVLPCSGVIELLAVGLFAVNLALTLLQPPAHLRPAVAIS